MIEICQIVAVDKKNCIGKDNRLPWHIPSDLKYFKECTNGFPIIMGRKTYESIGRPLPNRLNVVLSRSNGHEFPESVKIANSIKESLEFALDDGKKKIFIIGGAQIFKETLKLTDKVYITKVNTEVEGGDTFYPTLPEGAELISKKESHDQFDLSFEVYSLKKK